jgi:hypothetical protein
LQLLCRVPPDRRAPIFVPASEDLRDRETEVERVLAIWKKHVRDVELPVAVRPELPDALARRVLPGIREVDQPGRGEDPVLDALVVVAVGGEELIRAVMVGVGGGRPFLRVLRLAEERERSHREPGRRDEVVFCVNSNRLRWGRA